MTNVAPRLWFGLVIALLAPHGVVGAADTGPIAVVAQLYRDYAWEAVVDTQDGATVFIDEPQAVLERYLTPDLAALIVADRACVRRTQELCNLDFSPLWDAQDPGATMLEIEDGKEAGDVTVSFLYPGNGKRIVISYRTTPGPSGWRIADIRYDSGAALRSMLQGAP